MDYETLELLVVDLKKRVEFLESNMKIPLSAQKIKEETRSLDEEIGGQIREEIREET